MLAPHTTATRPTRAKRDREHVGHAGPHREPTLRDTQTDVHAHTQLTAPCPHVWDPTLCAATCRFRAAVQSGRLVQAHTSERRDHGQAASAVRAVLPLLPLPQHRPREPLSPLSPHARRGSRERRRSTSSRRSGRPTTSASHYRPARRDARRDAPLPCTAVSSRGHQQLRSASSAIS